MRLFDQYKGLQKEVYVICICTIIDKMGSLIGPMFTLILSTLIGLDATKIATWALIYSAISLPAGVWGGRLADKANKKLLINICDISSGVIYIVCGFLKMNSNTIAFYLFGCLLQTIESSSYSVLIGDITTTKDRNRAMSLKYLCINFGMVLAPIFGGFLLKSHPGLIFIISGIAQLLSLLIFDIYIKETKTKADKDNTYEAINNEGNFKEVLKDNMPVCFFILLSAVTMLCYDQFTYILPLDFSATYGANGSIFYGTVSSVNCITVLIATSVMTLLTEKMTSISKMALGEVLEIIGFILMVGFISYLPVTYFGCFVFTLGEIVETVTCVPHCMNRIPANFRGRISAFRETLTTLVVSFGNLLIGKLYDNAGSNITWLAVTIIIFMTIVGFLIIKKYDKEKYPNLY